MKKKIGPVQEKRKRGRPPKQEADAGSSKNTSSVPKRRGRPPKTASAKTKIIKESRSKHNKDAKSESKSKCLKTDDTKSIKKTNSKSKTKITKTKNLSKNVKNTSVQSPKKTVKIVSTKSENQEINDSHQRKITEESERESSKQKSQTRVKKNRKRETASPKKKINLNNKPLVKIDTEENQHCLINCCSCNRSIYYDTKRTDSNTNKTVERTSKNWGYVFCPHCGTANITRFYEDILGRLE